MRCRVKIQLSSCSLTIRLRTGAATQSQRSLSSFTPCEGTALARELTMRAGGLQTSSRDLCLSSLGFSFYVGAELISYRCVCFSMRKIQRLHVTSALKFCRVSGAEHLPAGMRGVPGSHPSLRLGASLKLQCTLSCRAHLVPPAGRRSALLPALFSNFRICHIAAPRWRCSTARGRVRGEGAGRQQPFSAQAANTVRQRPEVADADAQEGGGDGEAVLGVWDRRAQPGTRKSHSQLNHWCHVARAMGAAPEVSIAHPGGCDTHPNRDTLSSGRHCPRQLVPSEPSVPCLSSSLIAAFHGHLIMGFHVQGNNGTLLSPYPPEIL